MARHYIGATTLTDGKATFPYICKGDGELEIKASVREGSETLFEDKAVTGKKNSNFDNYNATVTTDETGTTLTASGYSTYFADNPSHTGLYDWTAPFTIECDIISATGSNDIQIYDGTNNINKTFTQMGVDGNNHLQIVVGNNSVDYYVDGVNTLSVSATMGDCRVGFRTATNGGGTIKYRNFIIYSLGGGEETISTPTPILDCINYDKGTQANHNDIYYANPNADFSRLTDYSTLKTKSGASSFGNIGYLISSTSFIVEFDTQITLNTTGWIFTIRNNGTIKFGVTGSNIGISDENWHNIKIKRKDDIFTYYLDDESIFSNTITDSFDRFQIDARDGSIINFKEFKVYPI